MDPGGLRVDLRAFEGGVLLALHGELDGESAPHLRQKVEVLLAAAPSVVVVDLQGLQFVDAKGLHALLECDRLLRRLCEAVVVQGVRPNVRRAMDVVGVSGQLRLDGAP